MHKPCDILVLQFGKKQTPCRSLELLGSPMGHAIKKAPPGLVFFVCVITRNTHILMMCVLVIAQTVRVPVPRWPL